MGINEDIIPHFTVTRISEIIKNTIEQTFSIVNIIGEISNLTVSPKYAFFSLKDEESLIKCVVWSPSVEVKDMLKNGEKVVVTGKITTYKSGSYYQVTAYKIKTHGIGDIANQFATLKVKLQKEGLFDEKYKKSLPKYVQNIAVISAKNSAAIEDILKTLKSTIVRTTHFIPATMQGNSCANSVISSLKVALQLRPEVIIIARGGGSFEDLNEFNNEALARVVFECDIPVISAIGHETDFTILDFVSDVRAPTPTYAAQIVSPQKIEVLSKIHALEAVILQKTHFEIMKYKYEIEKIERFIRDFVASRLDYEKGRINSLEVKLQKNNFLSFTLKVLHNVLILEQKLERINPRAALKLGFSLLQSGGRFESNHENLPEIFDIVTHHGSFSVKKVSVI